LLSNINNYYLKHSFSMRGITCVKTMYDNKTYNNDEDKNAKKKTTQKFILKMTL